MAQHSDNSTGLGTLTVKSTVTETLQTRFLGTLLRNDWQRNADERSPAKSGKKLLRALYTTNYDSSLNIISMLVYLRIQILASSTITLFNNILMFLPRLETFLIQCTCEPGWLTRHNLNPNPSYLNTTPGHNPSLSVRYNNSKEFTRLSKKKKKKTRFFMC
jgi:hypothetical protein